MSPTEDAFVLRPAPIAGVAIGVVVLLAIGLPPLLLDTRHYLATSGVPVTLVLGLCIAALVQYTRWRVELVRDKAKGELRIRRVRAPLATVETVMKLDAIARVELQTRTRNAARVVLVMRSGEQVPLTAGMSSTDDHDKAAAVLRDWVSG